MRIVRRASVVVVGGLISGLLLFDLWLSNDSIVLKMSSSSANKPAPSNPLLKTKNLFYYHDPNLFVQKFSRCLIEGDSCHVFYWHIQKTGGSFLASTLYQIFNRMERYNSKEWCCNDKFMKTNFWQNVSAYCSKRMGVYEVRPHQYQQVVQACQNYLQGRYNTSDATERNHRYIGLISIRQPIERTLSAIHQRCNVHSNNLDNVTRSVCERCDYSNDIDKPFFEKFVNDTNDIYTSTKKFMLSSSAMGIPLYVIDNEHMTEFFEKSEEYLTDSLLHAGMYLPNNTFHFPKGKPNAEASQKLCDFGMPSALMKQHRDALNVYHWLWSGEYLWQ